jgi:RHS repeat-associated protein
VQKAGPSWATYLYGPGGQLLSALEGSVGYTDYVYFGGRLLFTLNQGSMGPGYTKVTRIFGDRLGSTRGTYTTDPYYPLSWTTRNYYPFGEEIGSTANNEYKFASTYRDSSTGLDYAVNRYHASGMGRFLTPDYYTRSASADSPQTFNRYNYAGNDPVNMTDPDGLFVKNVPPTPPDPGTREGAEIEGPRGEGQPPEGGGGRLNKQTLVNGADALMSKADCGNFITGTLQKAFLVANEVSTADQLGQYEREIYDQISATPVRSALGSADFNDAGVAKTETSGGKTFTILAEAHFSASGTSSIAFYNAFFDQGSTARYQTTIHEGMHLFWGLTDAQFAKAAGTYRDGMSSLEASEAWNGELKKNCK